MTSPGEYSPDPTAGITDPKNLPKPIIKKKSRIKKKCRCPFCKRAATRHGTRTRTLHDLGDLGSGRPVDVQFKHSTHYCCKCKKYFNVQTTDIAAPKGEYTKAVVDLAVRLVVEDQLPLREASWHLWRKRAPVKKILYRSWRCHADKCCAPVGRFPTRRIAS